MIESLRVRGLRALCRQDRSVGVAQRHVAKLERILSVLDRSCDPEGMDLPGFRFHPLKGQWKGFHAVSVSGDWRVIFRFEHGHSVDVDYVDYR